ncbi:ComEA family DNA-binding protein [Acinetobacter sp. SH20PTE14]|nr:ComEA family DNA-binding protein [Acinetobacter sp. SH20PTE14]UIJ75224.1 ComEA family DNA-binding protein [Acinetobacter sp. SH20PTE14]
MADLTYARNPSGYAEWKALQQAKDQQLKKQSEAPKSNVTTASSNANYYLSRPSTQQNSRTDQVRLNTASVDELQTLHGIGQKKAEAIVQYRKSNGLFKSIDDIQQVKGIGPALFAKNKAKLAL